MARRGNPTPDANLLVQRVAEEQRRLASRFPDMDPGDLALIIKSLLCPVGSGRRFILRRRADGGYDF